MEKKHIIIFLIGLFLVSFVSESFSQRRSSRTRPTTRDRDNDRSSREDTYTSFKDKLAYDVFLGTLGFNSGFSASAKGAVGYKVIDRITLGGGLKFSYVFANNFGTANDFSSFSYGAFPFARFKITDKFYGKAEYNFYTFDTGFDNADRINFSFPQIGGGYIQGIGKWKIGFEILLLINDSEIDNSVFNGVTASDLYTLIEYNIAFLYNF